MQLSSTLIAILASVSLASGKCFDSGPSWGDATALNQAKHSIKKCCESNLGGHTFQKGDKRTACYNLGKNKKVTFSMWHHGSGRREMNTNDCVKHLTQFIDGCNHGGQHTDGQWEYS